MLPRILISDDERGWERKCHLQAGFLREAADWWLQTANRVSFTCKEILSAVGNGGNVEAGRGDKDELSCITFMRGVKMEVSLSYWRSSSRLKIYFFGVNKHFVGFKVFLYMFCSIRFIQFSVNV